MVNNSLRPGMTDPHSAVLISLVIPVYNEEDNIGELHNQLVQVLSTIGWEYEIIFVDDGSTDRTLQWIEALCRDRKEVKVLSLARNFGHQIALTAGLHHASGDLIITMDGDLQHPPQLVSEMIRRWEEGYDVVYTRKLLQEERGLVKRFMARLFYKTFSAISDVTVDPNASDFRLISRRVLAVLNSMPEQQRFLRGLVSWMGFRQIGLPYKAPPRFGGRPKYTLRRLGRLASYGIASFSTFPLRAPLYIGLPLTLFGIAYVLYLMGRSVLIDTPLSGPAILFALSMVLGGLILTFLGIQGYYMAHIYQEVRKRPLYTVKKAVGLELQGPEKGTGQLNSI